MNNKPAASAPANGGQYAYNVANMTPEQQRLVQEDLADRERQASALAAAGMVAENKTGSMPVVNGMAGTVGLSQQGLHAPPLLGSVAPLPPPDPAASNSVDGINWGLSDLGQSLDDMEMDFAKMFDPAHEEASMKTEGSGWPAAGGGEQKVAPDTTMSETTTPV